MALPIPLCRPELGDAEVAAAARALRSGWVSQGAEVVAFEAETAALLGLPHAVATSSCTAALWLSLRLLDLPVGAEVLVPSFGFPAPINAVLHAGLRPVLVDVDPATLNLDPAEVERRAPGAAAVIAVHQFGLLADMEPICEVAQRHGLAVVEDAACALGSSSAGRPAGSWGRFATLSFHARKVVTTGEGGMLLTRDPEAAEQARRHRSQGATTSALEQHGARRPRLPGFPAPGFQFRMSDLSAAVGRAQLQGLGSMLARRRRIAERYRSVIADLPAVVAPDEAPGVRHAWQSFCCVLTDRAPVSRDQLIGRLRDAGVGASVGAVVAHHQPAFAAFAAGPLPASDRLAERAFLLPLFPGLADADVERVLAALRQALAE